MTPNVDDLADYAHAARVSIEHFARAHYVGYVARALSVCHSLPRGQFETVDIT